MSDARFGPWLTTHWVQLYTRGLAREVRAARSDEIASDVWEHRHDHLIRGVGRWTTNTEVTRRTVAGIPADLSWRRSQRHAHQASEAGGDTMSMQRLWSFTRLLIVVQGVALIVFSVGVVTEVIGFTNDSNWNPASGIAFAVFGAAMLAGLAVRRTRGALGVGMICISSLFMVGAYWYSVLFLIGLVTFVLALITAPWNRAAKKGWSAQDALEAHRSANAARPS